MAAAAAAKAEAAAAAEAARRAAAPKYELNSVEKMLEQPVWRC